MEGMNEVYAAAFLLRCARFRVPRVMRNHDAIAPRRAVSAKRTFQLWRTIQCGRSGGFHSGYRQQTSRVMKEVKSRFLSLRIVLRVYPLEHERPHAMKLHDGAAATRDEVMHSFGRCGE